MSNNGVVKEVLPLGEPQLMEIKRADPLPTYAASQLTWRDKLQDRFIEIVRHVDEWIASDGGPMVKVRSSLTNMGGSVMSAVKEIARQALRLPILREVRDFHQAYKARHSVYDDRERWARKKERYTAWMKPVGIGLMGITVGMMTIYCLNKQQEYENNNIASRARWEEMKKNGTAGETATMSDPTKSADLASPPSISIPAEAAKTTANAEPTLQPFTAAFRSMTSKARENQSAFAVANKGMIRIQQPPRDKYPLTRRNANGTVDKENLEPFDFIVGQNATHFLVELGPGLTAESVPTEVPDRGSGGLGLWKLKQGSHGYHASYVAGAMQSYGNGGSKAVNRAKHMRWGKRIRIYVSTNRVGKSQIKAFAWVQHDPKDRGITSEDGLKEQRINYVGADEQATFEIYDPSVAPGGKKL